MGAAVVCAALLASCGSSLIPPNAVPPTAADSPLRGLGGAGGGGQPIGGGQPGGGGGQPPGGGGQPRGGAVPPAPLGHGCGSAQSPAVDAQEMSSWIHWVKTSFSGFAPDDKWNIVESMSGVDVSSPIGDADAGFGFVTGTPGPSTVEQIQDLTLRGVNLGDYQVIGRSATTPLGGGDCQEIEFTATIGGSTPVHGVLTAVVFNNPSTGYGFYTRTAIASVAVWQADARTLQLILDHLTFMGRNGNQ